MDLDAESALLKQSKYVKFAQDIRSMLTEVDKSLSRTDSNAQIVSSRLRNLQNCLEERRSFLDVPEKASVLRTLQACLVDCSSAGVHKQATQTLDYMIKLMGPNLTKSLPLFLVSLLCRLPQAASETVTAMRDLLKGVIQRTNGNLLKPCAEGIIAGLLPALEQTATGDDKESMKLLDALFMKLAIDCQKHGSPTRTSGEAKKDAAAGAAAAFAGGPASPGAGGGGGGAVPSQGSLSGALLAAGTASPTEGIRVFFRVLWYFVAYDPNLRMHALVLLSARLFREVPGVQASAESIKAAYLGGDPALAVRALCIAALDTRENTQAKLLELLLRHLALDSDILDKHQKIEILSRVLFIATTNRNAMLMRLIRWVYGGNTELDEAVQYFKRVSHELVSEALLQMVRRSFTQRETEVLRGIGRDKAYTTSAIGAAASASAAAQLSVTHAGTLGSASGSSAGAGGGVNNKSLSGAGGAAAGAGGIDSKNKSAPQVFQVIIALLQREESTHTFGTLLPTLGPVITDWVTTNIAASMQNNNSNSNINNIVGATSATTPSLMTMTTQHDKMVPAVANYLISITAQVLDVVPVELFIDPLVSQVRQVALSAIDGGENLNLVQVAEGVIKKTSIGLHIVAVFLETSASASGSMVTTSSTTISRHSVKALVNCARQLCLCAAALISFMDVQGRGTAISVLEQALALCSTIVFRIAPAVVNKAHHRRAIISGVLFEAMQLFQFCLVVLIPRTAKSPRKSGNSLLLKLSDELQTLLERNQGIATTGSEPPSPVVSSGGRGAAGRGSGIDELSTTSAPAISISMAADSSNITVSATASELCFMQVKMISLFDKIIRGVRALVTEEERQTIEKNASTASFDSQHYSPDGATNSLGGSTSDSSPPSQQQSTTTTTAHPHHHSHQDLHDSADIVNRVRGVVDFALTATTRSDPSVPYDNDDEQDHSTMCPESMVSLSRFWLSCIESVPANQVSNSVHETSDIVLHALWRALHPSTISLHCDAVDVFLPLAKIRANTALELVTSHNNNSNNSKSKANNNAKNTSKIVFDSDHARRCTLLLTEVSKQQMDSLRTTATGAAEKQEQQQLLWQQPAWVVEALFLVCSVTEQPVEAATSSDRTARGICETWIRNQVTRSLLFLMRPVLLGTVSTTATMNFASSSSSSSSSSASSSQQSPDLLRYPSYIRQLRGIALATQNDLIRNALSHELRHRKIDEAAAEGRTLLGDFFLHSSGGGGSAGGAGPSASSSSSAGTNSTVLAAIVKATGKALSVACGAKFDPQQHNDIRSLTGALKSAMSSAVQTGSAGLNVTPMPPVVMDCVRLVLDILKGTCRWAPTSQLQQTLPIVASLVHMLLWVLRQALQHSWVDTVGSIVGTVTIGLDFLHRHAVNAVNSGAAPASSAAPPPAPAAAPTPSSQQGDQNRDNNNGNQQQEAGGSSGPPQSPVIGPSNNASSSFVAESMVAEELTATTALGKLVATCIETASALFYGAVVYEMVGTFSGLGVVQVAGEFILNALRWSGPLLAAATDAFAEVNDIIICLSMNAPLSAASAYAISAASDSLQGIMSTALKLQDVVQKKSSEAAAERDRDRDVFGGGFGAAFGAFGAANISAGGGGGAGGGGSGGGGKSDHHHHHHHGGAGVSSVGLVPRQALVEAILKLRAKVSSTTDIAIAVETFLQSAKLHPSRARHVAPVHQSIQSLVELCLQLGEGNVVDRTAQSIIPPTNNRPMSAVVVDAYNYAMSPSTAPRDLLNPLRLLLGSGSSGVLLPGQFVRLVTESMIKRRQQGGGGSGGGGHNIKGGHHHHSAHSDADADLYAAYCISMYIHELFAVVDGTDQNTSPVFGSASALNELRAGVLTFINSLVNPSDSGSSKGSSSSSSFNPFTLPILIKLLDTTLARCQTVTAVEHTSGNLVGDAFAALTLSKEGIRLPELFQKLVTLCVGNVPTSSAASSAVLLQQQQQQHQQQQQANNSALRDCTAQVAVRIFQKDPERLGKFVISMLRENLSAAIDAAAAADVRVTVWWTASVTRALVTASGACKLNESQTLSMRSTVAELLFKESFFNIGHDAIQVMQEMVAEISTCTPTFNTFILKCGERPRFRLTSSQQAEECVARARGLKRLAFFLYASRLGTRELYTRLPQVRELITDTIRIANKREEDCPAQTHECLRMTIFVFRVLLYKVPPEHTKLLQALWTALFPESVRILHSFVLYRLNNSSSSKKEQNPTLVAERFLITEIIKMLDFANVLTPSDLTPFRWMFCDAHAARTGVSFAPLANVPPRYRPDSSISGRFDTNGNPIRPRNAVRHGDSAIPEFDGADATPCRPLFALRPVDYPTNTEGTQNMIAAFAQFIEQADNLQPDSFVSDAAFGPDVEDEAKRLFGAGFTKREDGVDLNYVDWLLECDFLESYAESAVLGAAATVLQQQQQQLNNNNNNNNAAATGGNNNEIDSLATSTRARAASQLTTPSAGQTPSSTDARKRADTVSINSPVFSSQLRDAAANVGVVTPPLLPANAPRSSPAQPEPIRLVASVLGASAGQQAAVAAGTAVALPTSSQQSTSTNNNNHNKASNSNSNNNSSGGNSPVAVVPTATLEEPAVVVVAADSSSPQTATAAQEEPSPRSMQPSPPAPAPAPVAADDEGKGTNNNTNDDEGGNKLVLEDSVEHQQQQQHADPEAEALPAASSSSQQGASNSVIGDDI